MGNLNEHSKSLSIFVISTLLFWYVSVLGSLTIFTHIAQILALQFRFYSIITLFIAIGVSVGVLFLAKILFSANPPYDIKSLCFILLLGVVASIISISIRRVGRISPDEYFYGANPVYFLQHPTAAMGFEDRTLYGGNALFSSISFHTAGAYEYLLGAFASLLDVSFITMYYRLAAALAGFAVPLGLFLVIVYFSESVSGAVIGTFFSTFFITMLGEASWTPGAYSFVRIFEGKIVFLFVGISLFVFFSLEQLKRNDFPAWIQLFMLNTAAVGLSSSSIMVLPILGSVIFSAYWITFGDEIKSLKDFLTHFASYFSSFAYLVLFALFIAFTDTIEKSAQINATSSESFIGYLSGFVNPNFPITPFLVIISSLAVLFLTKNKTRLYLVMWMVFAFLFALNPVTAQFLLKFFRGVYFRLFYIFPFLFNLGIIFSSLFNASQRLSQAARSFLWSGTCFIFIIASVLMPSSIFQGDRFVMGSTIEDEDLMMAKAIVEVAPKGVMLAPYPLSGAINMIDSGYPQLISRNDNMVYLLNSQGRDAEFELRFEVSAFLSKEEQNTHAFMRLVKQYSEIRSIVISSGEVKSNNLLQKFLLEEGFINRKRTGHLLVVWR